MKWKNYYKLDLIYFFTSRITGRLPLLRTSQYKQFLVNAFQKYRQRYSISIYGYVLMNNHFHILISGKEGKSVQRFIQHSLRESSLKITKALEQHLVTKHAAEAATILQTFSRRANGKTRYAVWKEQARGVPVYTEKMCQMKLDYIHDNPVRAGLVTEPSEYPFSSYCSIYLNEDGFLPISLPPWFR